MTSSSTGGPSTFLTHTIPTDATAEKDQTITGPLSVLMFSVKAGTPVLVSLRNNHKLFGKVKAFDRHCNMVMEGTSFYFFVVTGWCMYNGNI